MSEKQRAEMLHLITDMPYAEIIKALKLYKSITHHFTQHDVLPEFDYNTLVDEAEVTAW